MPVLSCLETPEDVASSTAVSILGPDVTSPEATPSRLPSPEDGLRRDSTVPLDGEHVNGRDSPARSG